MASSAEWSHAFLEQARSDLRAAEVIAEREPSVFAMLMQMVFEKLAKAALLRTGRIGIDRATTSHRAASMMASQLKRARNPLIGAWQDILDIVPTLENAHPAIEKNGPHLEYPWEAPNGSIKWPAQHLPIVLELGDPRSRLGQRTLQLGVRLEREFENIFT